MNLRTAVAVLTLFLVGADTEPDGTMRKTALASALCREEFLRSAIMRGMSIEHVAKLAGPANGNSFACGRYLLYDYPRMRATVYYSGGKADYLYVWGDLPGPNQGKVRPLAK